MNFTFSETMLPGCFVIDQAVFSDQRGQFIKVFHDEVFKRQGLQTDFKESFFSVSKKNVIRGMHFQTPPFDHVKLATVVSGQIIDVVLDLRRDLPTYGEFIAVDMSTKKHQSIYIPKGCAHGFLSLSEDTVVSYSTNTVYSQKSDTGILYHSFGYVWPVEYPIVSQRDLSFVNFKDYNSPFVERK